MCSGFTGHAGTAGREVEGGAAHGRARGHIYARSVLLLLLLLLLLSSSSSSLLVLEDEDDRGWTRGRDPLPTSGRLVPHQSRPVASSLFRLALSPSHLLSSVRSSFSSASVLFALSICRPRAHSLSRSRARNETTTAAAAFSCRTAAPRSPVRRVTRNGV